MGDDVDDENNNGGKGTINDRDMRNIFDDFNMRKNVLILNALLNPKGQKLKAARDQKLKAARNDIKSRDVQKASAAFHTICELSVDSADLALLVVT